MKLFLILLGMSAAGVLGYLAEPALRPTVTGVPSKGGAAGANTAQVTLIPSAPAMNPASLAPEQLPATVSLREEIKFTDEQSGLSMTIATGSRVKLLRIEGSMAVVRPGDTTYTLKLPHSKTNLMEQLAAHPPSTLPSSAATPAATPAPAPAPAPEPTPTPTPAPEPTPAPAPAPAPAPTGESVEPPPAPAPVDSQPEPKPEPAPAPAPAPAPEVPVDAVQVMQESIRSQEIKEFTFNQVLEWKPDANETVDGEEFQTGIVSYKAETIFGVKTIQAKALIKGGKVQRWIWPKSGMEIK